MNIRCPQHTCIAVCLAILFLHHLSFSQIRSSPYVATRLNDLESQLNRFLERDDEPRAAMPVRSRVVGTSRDPRASVALSVPIARAVFNLLNQKRIENGQRPLTWSDDLARAATLHSHNMASYHFISHRGLDQKMVFDRARDVGLRSWRSIGENIAFETRPADPVSRTVQLLMNSPSHRQNVLSSDWTDTAVAVAIAPDGGYYFTEVFMRRR
jgi:uncharacterized protein YkwD